MTSVRPWRPAMDHATACREVWAGAGTQFDIAVVAAFRRAVAASAPGIAAEAA